MKTIIFSMSTCSKLVPAILLLILSMWQATATASDPQGRLPFQTYSRESGLKNLRINLLLQDKQGFIWVGTDDGAYRFDGHRFQAFGLEQGLPSLEINAFQLDATGAMWVGTKLGPARWNGDRFESGFKGYPDKLTVDEFILGPSQELWIGTKEGVFRGSAMGFQAVPNWKSGHVKSLALGSDGATVWAGTNSQVWTWRSEQGWKLFPGGPVHEAKELLDRLFAGPDGRIWARTRRANYVLEPGAQHFTLIPELPAADSFLSRFHLGSDGAIWIPTEKGVYRYHKGQFSNIGLIDGLPTDFTRAVLLDREGNLWCGSVGLHRLMGRGAWRSHTPKEGLPTIVWSIFRDRSGQLWSGTQKGLAQANAHGWRVIPGTESIQVRSITQAADGSLIFGGDPYGLWRWDGMKLHALPPLPASNALTDPSTN